MLFNYFDKRYAVGWYIIVEAVERGFIWVVFNLQQKGPDPIKKLSALIYTKLESKHSHRLILVKWQFFNEQQRF